MDDYGAEDSVRRFFGQRIKERREARGLRQDQLAEALHVPFEAVRYWEAGKRAPGLYVLNRLPIILDTDLDYLLRGVETAEHHEESVLRTLAARIGAAAQDEAELLIKKCSP